MNVVFAPLKILDDIAGDLYSTVKNALTHSRDAFIKNLEIGFGNYISNRHKRYSKVHTLLSPHEPLAIDDIYVEPDVTIAEKKYRGDYLIDLIHKHHILIVQGIAGQGKSMLMRHIFCQFCSVNYGFIPIFLELRDVNFESDDLVSPAFRELSDESRLFSRNDFEALLKTGKFIFLLDGFDEIKTKSRKLALRKIDNFSKEFSRCRIVLTSRPSELFEGWHPASILEIQEYELPQILDLISKSPIKGEVKDAFRPKVEQDYIHSHERFLSNPLLCNMMILTFLRGGDIPSQKHIFYRKAFETLYRHHDDMKFLYKRDYHSDLPEDVFVRLWRAFCYFSYVDRKFSFDAASLAEYIRRAARYIEVTINEVDVAADFVESLCVIVRDGENYSFLHRSFQEYSVAVFIAYERISGIKSVIDRIFDNIIYDDVIDLSFNINRELIEQEYILPRLDRIIKDLRSRKGNKAKIGMFYGGMILDRNIEESERVIFKVDPRAQGEGGEAYFLSFVRRIYRKPIDPQTHRALGGLASEDARSRWIARLS
jgi:hypothetical protein